MIALVSDQNFKQQIVNGLRRRLADLDLVSVREVGLAEAEDPALLAWAAAEDRVLITHDVNTIPGFAYQRAADGDPMPGVVVVPATLPIGDAIRGLLRVLEASSSEDLVHRILFLPIRSRQSGR